MARSTRMVVGLVLFWIVASFLMPAGTAAAGRPCLPSGGCASIRYAGDLTGSRGGQMQLGWRLYLTGTDIAAASLYLDSPTGLSLLADSVTLNGVPAPAAVQVVGSRSDLTVDLASVLPLASAPGNITVGYAADVAADAKAEIYLGADLSYSDGGTNSASAVTSVTLQVAFPDIAISTTGSDTYIPRGQDASVFFGITSSGEIDPPDVSLEIRTPVGFILTTTPAGTLNCHPIAVRRTFCTLVFHQPVVAGTLGIRAEAGTQPGQTGDLVLITQPLGTPADSKPADNTHHMKLHVRGIADLSERWQVPAGGAIPLGEPATVSAVITNNGPDPATGLSGWITLPENSGSGSVGIRVKALTGTISERRLWIHIARLAPHTSYSVPLRVTGLKLGVRSTLSIQFSYPSFPASSGLVEPVVSYDPTAAEAPTSVTLTVVAASAPAGGKSLPATGPTGALPATITGSTMLLTGLVFLLLARRRRIP